MSTPAKRGRPRVQAETCRRAGCCGKSYSRGMCRNHYEVWRRAFPEQLRPNDSRQDVLDVLPATCATGAQKTGLSKDRVVRIVRALKEEGKVYILKFVPPVGRGGPWKAVYARGNRPDAVRDPAAVRAHALAVKRQHYHSLDHHPRLLAKRSANRISRRSKKKPQGIFAALGL